MSFNISLWDMGTWSAMSSIAILLASEILSPHYGKVNIQLDTKKLRIVALAFIILFVIIALMNVADVIRE